MNAFTFLEPFDGQAADARADTPPQELPGYAAGFQDGIQQAGIEQSALRCDVVEKFAEMSFTYAEASQAILQSLNQFFQALGGQVLPALLQEIERSHLIACLNEAAKDHVTPTVVLKVPKTDLPSLEALLPSPPTFPIQFKEEDSLNPGSKLLVSNGEETLIDVPKMIADLQSILCSIEHMPAKDMKNG